MYAKLIFKNAKRSVKDCLIYIVTMTLCVTLFYAFLSISSTHYHPTIGAEYNISLLAGGMKLAICGISLLLLFLIHYVNRFMLRKKQSEFAVEATLGMEQKTIGLLFFGETFFLLIFSVSVGILLGMIVSQVITAMLLASFGEPYAFSWSFFPDTVLLTVGFFVICQILVGVGNVRILNKSRIIELMTANRQNEKPLHKSRWMPMICIFYGIMLLWMLEVGAVKYHFYFDPRHPLPVKLMYWGNVLFPALTLLWAIAGAVLHRKIGFSRYLCGLLAGAVLTAIPIFSIAELEKAYFLGFDAPTLNQYLLFGVADILFIISAVIYLSNAALLYWKESKVSCKYHNTSLFLFGQLSSKLATNTKTMTIICVTLTFSICLFVIAPVLTGWSLGYLDSRAVYDIQISSRYNDVYEVENLPDTDYGEITAFIEQNNIAIKDDLTFSEYLPQKSDFHQRVKYDFPPLAIALKDYNAVRKMLGYEPIILQTDEFATHWHRAAEDKDIENYIAEHTLLETDAGTLKLSENAVFQEPVGESIYNLYTDVVYIIPDEIAQVLLITLADFYGVSVDYLLCRTENREQINTSLTELHLNDEMVALLKSGRINNRLLCELATHKDFIKFLADIEIYVDGIATMQIQNLNTLVDTVRHEIIERYRPGEDDPHLKVLQAAHISDDEYFSHMVLDDLNLIIRDIREAHKKDSESAPQTTVADELKENLEAVENFKGSRDEKLVVLYCKQLGINYKNLSDEEFRWLIRILKKSKKMGTPISQRKKR